MQLNDLVTTQYASFIIETFNVFGIIAFAISGAIAGIRRQSDIFGIMVLAFATSSFGGITRDLLLGDVPPAVIQGSSQLYLTLGAAIMTYWGYPLVRKMQNPIEFFDALGLGAFTVLGANKALEFGISPVWAITLGMITAVGGGIGRDMLLAQVPIILQKEVYATAAIVGAAILVIGKMFFPEAEDVLLVLGAIICSAVRLLAVYKKWHLPRRKDPV